MICVAIDGPAGCGKSTVSKLLAKKLGYASIDTGALYRAVAYFFKRENIDFNSDEAVRQALKNIDLRAENLRGKFRVFLSGEDVTEKIRSEEISMFASKISKIASVREFLLEIQRDFARENSVVMDGRDIGTVVMPNAEVKIFLTASEEERAKRRFKEFAGKFTFEEVLNDLKKRDFQDMNREISPLRKASDAILVDNSDMTLMETVNKILGIVKERANLK